MDRHVHGSLVGTVGTVGLPKRISTDLMGVGCQNWPDGIALAGLVTAGRSRCACPRVAINSERRMVRFHAFFLACRGASCCEHLGRHILVALMTQLAGSPRPECSEARTVTHKHLYFASTK